MTEVDKLILSSSKGKVPDVMPTDKEKIVMIMSAFDGYEKVSMQC